MDRIIEVKVGGNYLSKDNKNAGVKGEANVTKLRITFDEGWKEYAKTVTFWDALGANPVKIVLTKDLWENKTEDTGIYIVPVPAEPMAVAGMLTFVIDGYIDGKRQRSIADELVVKDAPVTAGDPVDPTPTQAEQLQVQIEGIKNTIQNATKARDEAKTYRDEAEDFSQKATKKATSAEENAKTAAEKADEAEQSAIKAEKAVGKTSYIGDNGNWYAWDSSTGAFYDTGVKAQAGSTVYLGDNPPPEADVWVDPDGDVDGIPDWNQNDETATNHIKNRTHYDATYYMGGVEVQNAVDEDYVVTFDYPLEVGKEYKYSFDFGYPNKETGVTEHSKEEGMLVITELPEEGQTIELTIGSKKGQLKYDGVYYSWELDDCSATSGILSFYGGELKKLDEKYIPDTIVKKKDDAMLLAMYNEVIEPSPEEWFVVDEEDPSIIVDVQWLDWYFTNAKELVFPYEINGVGIREIRLKKRSVAMGGSDATVVRFPNCITSLSCFDSFATVAPGATSINIPTSCTSLGSGCFSNMSLLKEVISPIKPNWEMSIGEDCFEGCFSLNNIDTIIDGIKELPRGAFCNIGRFLKNATIPESVDVIKEMALAFGQHTNCITFLNPECDLSAGKAIFVNDVDSEFLPKVIKGYTGSTAEELARKLRIPFISLDNTNKDDTTLLAMYNEIIEPSPEDWFVVDENDPSTIVGFNLDDYGDTLWEEDEIVFPYEINGVGIRKIHFSYFSYQLQATKIRFPNCITEIRTEGTCFGLFAYNVESINIPTSCEYLSDMCFADMAALKEVISPIKPNWELTMGSGCFYACSALNNIDTIIDGLKEIPDAAFSDCSGVSNVILPESIERVGVDSLAFVDGGNFNCLTVLNPSCDFPAEGVTFTYEERYPKVIKGYTGSTAETLANEIGVTFVSLDGAEFDSIDEALDRIIAIQESLVGGESV